MHEESVVASKLLKTTFKWDLCKSAQRLSSMLVERNVRLTIGHLYKLPIKFTLYVSQLSL
jgi:hypothetical protein